MNKPVVFLSILGLFFSTQYAAHAQYPSIPQDVQKAARP